MTETVSVALGDRSYDIVIGPGLLADAARYLKPVLARPRVVVVTDEMIAGETSHLQTLQDSLRDGGVESDSIILPAGEGTKCFAQLENLCGQLLDANVNRDDVVVALGGGVIGDLVGFASAILRRGVNFVQVPTSLLAQVDSSVGGKTAINMAQGKNLIGAFYQPKLVLIDVSVLDTLPRREVLAGYAEVVKYGLLGDREFFDWLEEHGAAVVDGDVDARIHAVAESCRAKARIVAADEKEHGQRALLNLGHTFGHALEAEGGFDGTILHGEAVAIGMVQAFEISERLGFCPPQSASRVRAHLSALGLPVHPSDRGLQDSKVDDLLKHMAQDKKVRDGKLTFVLARRIGESFVTRDVSADQVRDYLTASV